MIYIYFLIREFINSNGTALTDVVDDCVVAHSNATASMNTSAGSSQLHWKIEVIEDVTASFCEQVRGLSDTVKQMDSALQRRSKLRTTGASNTGSTTPLSDSEKIALQVVLDIQAFGKEIQLVDVDSSLVPSYHQLMEFTDSNKFLK